MPATRIAGYRVKHPISKSLLLRDNVCHDIPKKKKKNFYWFLFQSLLCSVEAKP